MNHLPEMHIIESQITACETLVFHIPSPFSANTIIHVSVQVHPTNDQQFHAECWGDLPDSLPNVPRRQVLLGEFSIPAPANEVRNYHEFMDEIAKAVTANSSFANATKRLLGLHHTYHCSGD